MPEGSTIVFAAAPPAEVKADSPTSAPAPGFAAVAAPAPRPGMFKALKTQVIPTLKYLATTEAHTYAFSVAANAILSFFPAIVLFLTLTSKVLHNMDLYAAVVKLAKDFLPSNQDFIVGSMQRLASHHRIQIFSLCMLLVSSTGVFEPLEVALNKVWGIRKNRSYLGNQLVALALAFGCGAFSDLGGCQGKERRGAVVAGGESSFYPQGHHFSGRLADAEGGRLCRRHLHVFPHLLGSAERQGAGSLGVAGRHCHRRAIRSFEVRLYCAAAAVQLSGCLWAFLRLGHADLLGFLGGMLLLAGAHLSAAEHLLEDQAKPRAGIREPCRPPPRPVWLRTLSSGPSDGVREVTYRELARRVYRLYRLRTTG